MLWNYGGIRLDISLRNMYARSVFIFYLMIFLLILLNIIFIKGYLDGKKIKKEVFKLGKDLDNRKVKEYINFLDKFQILPIKAHQDFIKAGYEIVKMNNEVDEKLVKELKITILCKGIIVW